MAFTPVNIPIQELLLGNFVPDIVPVTNANSLLLKDRLEDLLNNLEIDTNLFSIGTDNPINYVRARSIIFQDTGFTFQTGTPPQVIARLEKNNANESILTVSRLNVSVSTSLEDLSVNSIVVNDDIITNGPLTVNSSLITNGSIVESKEAVLVDLVQDIPSSTGRGRLTLTNTSRRNIFVKLRASTSPDLDFIFDGINAFTVNALELYVDFDAANPPAQNTVFTIHLVDIIESQTQTSIIDFVTANMIPLKIRGGTNLNALPTAPVYLHGGLDGNPELYSVGVNPVSVNDGSNVLKSSSYTKYGHNISLMYILDENTQDRLIITGMVGMEFYA